MVFHLDQCAQLLQILDNLLAGFITAHALIFAAVCVDNTAVLQYTDDGQVVPLADLKVVGVMRRRNLDRACACLLYTSQRALC